MENSQKVNKPICEICKTEDNLFYCRWEGHGDVDFEHNLCQKCFRHKSRDYWNYLVAEIKKLNSR